MASDESSWWRRHGWTAIILTTAFSLAFLIRTLYVAPLIEQYGPLYLFAGGSDSFYHFRVSSFIIANHINLIKDCSLHYPVCAINPREPLFDWLNAVLGILLAPLFGGSATVAASWSLNFQPALWAGLGVLPVYLIGREVSTKRMGLIAAVLFGIIVASIDSSTFGYANYLSFYTFFILVALYGYLRTLKAAGSKRWIENYRQPRQYWPGLRAFLRTERTAVKWAVFTGVSLGALTLAWQGFTFLIAAIVVFIAVQMVIERIRRVDSFGVYVLTWIVALIGFAMAFPYYQPQGLERVWFLQPALLMFGALLVLLPFLLLRDTPWVISIPALLVTGAVAVGGLFVLDRADFTSIITGQGYFVKTLVYSTVAEAQAPSIDSLILGYGVVTFFLAFVGLALYFWRTVRDRFRRVQVMFIVFAILSVYLPISAAKFFLIGSAGFALLPAEALVRALDVGGYPTLRRNVASLSDRRSQVTAFRRAIKVRHILVMLLVLGILAPNVWYSIDAGIPYNNKGTYSSQVYDTLPVPLRTVPANATDYYLGAAGTELDTPNQYDEAGYNWLATQDTQLPEPQRPAFISWWDYGFQAVAEGNHPTVADNFQNGIDPAGNFLLSQNESQAIGILATTLLAGEQARTGNPYLTPALNGILARDGLNVATVHNLMVNQSSDIPLVIAHPERYLAVDPNNLDGQNAMYDAMAYYLATALPVNGVAQVYNDVQAYTGSSIRYAMVDSRLFPFSGQNTGIFYAPADLTDRVIGAGGAPTAYYTLSELGSDGNTYTPGNVPAGVTAVNYNINYEPAFYNSMIYRIFVGYNGTDIGQAAGIPGLTQNTVGADSPEPGWMLSHFQVVYRTGFYCPQANATPGTSCFSATNVPTAKALAKADKGTADVSTNSYYGGGEAMLEYYPGQTMSGTVELPDGTPVAGARVTVYDSWGIPHQSNVTGANGAYSVVLPPGNDRVNVTSGTLDGLTMAGATSLTGFNVTVASAIGLSLDAPPMVTPIIVHPGTVNGFVYWNTANNSSYVRAADPVVSNAVVTLSGPVVRNVTTDVGGTFVLDNLPPGTYNFTIRSGGGNFTEAQITLAPGSVKNETVGLSAGTITGRASFGSGFAAANAVITVTGLGGLVRTATADGNGNFSVHNLAVGNYSVTARAPGANVGAVGDVVAIATAGATTNIALTLVPLVTVAVPILLDGNPDPGVPVRFTAISGPPEPQSPTTNASQGAPGATTAQKSNSTVAMTGPDGVARAILPLANYSIYALALNGTRWYAGFSTAYLGPLTTANLPVIALTPAVQLSGTVSGAPGSSVGPAATQVTVFDGSGHQVSAFTNTSQTYSIWLPPGRYSVLATSSVPNSTATSAALSSVVLSYSTVLPIALGPGQVVRGVVGVPPSGGSGEYAAPGAVVTLTELPLNATVTTETDGAGNFSVTLPATVPPGASFCLSATATGFLPFQACSYSPSQLGSLGEVPMRLAPVPVTVTVNGLPSGSSATVNVTATAAPGQSVAKSLGPTSVLSLSPGSYRVSGWAKPSNGSGLLLPEASANLTVALGSSGANVTLTLVHQVVAKGHLVLPAGILNTSATVRLQSSKMSETVNGATFEKGFYLAPGTYALSASAPDGKNGTYTTMRSVVVNSTGAFSSSIPLSTEGVSVAGTFVGPSGAPLNASLTVRLTGPGGAVTTLSGNGGHFTTFLPPNATYGVAAGGTVLLPGPTGATEVNVTVAPSFAGCVVGAGPNATCTVPFLVSTIETTVSGNVSTPGFGSTAPATVEWVGPSPSANVTFANATNGTFSTRLLPGNYTVDAFAAGGAPYAFLGSVNVGTSRLSGLSFVLKASWHDAVTAVPPTGSQATTTTVTVTAPGGTVLTVTGVLVNTPLDLLLPPGVYRVAASVPGDPYGVPVNASANATVSLLAGNAATNLPLAYQFVRTVRFTTLDPTSVVVTAGSTVTFDYALKNTGNAPENISFVGSPAFWNFTFLPANVHLGVLPGNDTAGGEVRIIVPSGTTTSAPSVQLEAVDAVTKVPMGFAEPVPSVSIAPILGLSLGAESSVGASVGPFSATVPFYVLNTGNLVESTRITVADSVRLAGLGWTSTIESGGKPLTTAETLQPASNTSLTVVLTSPLHQALPPGSVEVSATVVNVTTELTKDVVLTVPALSVQLNNTTAIVTGPNLGSPSPYPDWLVPVLVFVPGGALIVGILVYRWRKTRRWTRR